MGFVVFVKSFSVLAAAYRNKKFEYPMRFRRAHITQVSSVPFFFIFIYFFNRLQITILYFVRPRLFYKWYQSRCQLDPFHPKDIVSYSRLFWMISNHNVFQKFWCIGKRLFTPHFKMNCNLYSHHLNTNQSVIPQRHLHFTHFIQMIMKNSDCESKTNTKRNQSVDRCDTKNRTFYIMGFRMNRNSQIESRDFVGTVCFLILFFS